MLNINQFHILQRQDYSTYQKQGICLKHPVSLEALCPMLNFYFCIWGQNFMAHYLSHYYTNTWSLAPAFE